MKNKHSMQIELKMKFSAKTFYLNFPGFGTMVVKGLYSLKVPSSTTVPI